MDEGTGERGEWRRIENRDKQEEEEEEKEDKKLIRSLRFQSCTPH